MTPTLDTKGVAYNKGYLDGYFSGFTADNPYSNGTPLYAEYESGREDGMAAWNKEQVYKVKGFRGLF